MEKYDPHARSLSSKLLAVIVPCLVGLGWYWVVADGGLEGVFLSPFLTSILLGIAWFFIVFLGMTPKVPDWDYPRKNRTAAVILFLIVGGFQTWVLLKSFVATIWQLEGLQGVLLVFIFFALFMGFFLSKARPAWNILTNALMASGFTAGLTSFAWQEWGWFADIPSLLKIVFTFFVAVLFTFTFMKIGRRDVEAAWKFHRSKQEKLTIVFLLTLMGALWGLFIWMGWIADVFVVSVWNFPAFLVTGVFLWVCWFVGGLLITGPYHPDSTETVLVFTKSQSIGTAICLVTALYHVVTFFVMIGDLLPEAWSINVRYLLVTGTACLAIAVLAINKKNTVLFIIVASMGVVAFGLAVMWESPLLLRVASEPLQRIVIGGIIAAFIAVVLMLPVVLRRGDSHTSSTETTTENTTNVASDKNA